MSKIWDALKKAEIEREPFMADGEGEVARTLTARQRAAVDALLNRASVQEACAACGVNERTLHRWLKTPGFFAAYHAASRARFADSVAQLKAASREATEVLRAALSDASSDVRVRAASAIVNAASRAELAAAITHASRRERAKPAK